MTPGMPAEDVSDAGNPLSMETTAGSHPSSSGATPALPNGTTGPAQDFADHPGLLYLDRLLDGQRMRIMHVTPVQDPHEDEAAAVGPEHRPLPQSSSQQQQQQQQQSDRQEQELGGSQQPRQPSSPKQPYQLRNEAAPCFLMHAGAQPSTQQQQLQKHEQQQEPQKSVSYSAPHAPATTAAATPARPQSPPQRPPTPAPQQPPTPPAPYHHQQQRRHRQQQRQRASGAPAPAAAPIPSAPRPHPMHLKPRHVKTNYKCPTPDGWKLHLVRTQRLQDVQNPTARMRNHPVSQ